MPNVHRTMRRCIAAAIAVTIVVAPAACGNDERVPEAQPTRWDAFTEGRFDDIPLAPRSRAVSELSEKADVVAQSYEVRNTSPEGVLRFYRDNLDGWTMVGDIEHIGVKTYRGVWRDEGYELTVSATDAPTLSEPGEVRSQYSLSLASP